MRRGTTPKINLKLNGISISDMTTIHISIRQNGHLITKDETEITIDGDVIHVPLTQEETLKFKSGTALIQLRALMSDGNAIASDMKPINILDVLEEGEIT